MSKLLFFHGTVSGLGKKVLILRKSSLINQLHLLIKVANVFIITDSP